MKSSFHFVIFGKNFVIGAAMQPKHASLENRDCR